jgi:hypothetical protein
MEEEMVDFFHESIEISFRLVSYPREQVVDDFLEAVFELCPK